MRPSNNDEDRFWALEDGTRTGISAVDLCDKYGNLGSAMYANPDNRGICETALYHFWVGVRLGCSWWKLDPTTLRFTQVMTDKWLGDTRCPDCDHYWRSSNPRTTVIQGGVTSQRCPECGNLATEAVELPERPITT